MTMFGIRGCHYKRSSFLTHLAVQAAIIVNYCTVVSGTDAISYRNMSKLHADLLVNYNRYIRPLQDQRSTMNISVIYTFKSLNDFDAVNGRMVTTGSLFARWRDEMMTWVPHEYGDIENVRMRETVVWVPTILLTNGADDVYIKGIKREDSSIVFDSKGMASFLLSGVMTSTCDPDITYYPYDKHNCSLQFTTQEPMNEISLYLSDIIMLPEADSNLLWELNNFHISTYSFLYYNTFIEISLTLERRPTYLIYTIILPISLLNFINLLAFVLPADSGERVSFATTILLTLSVYMTIMSDSIPNTSDPVSILTISLMIKLAMSSLIVLTVIMTLNLYHLSDATPVPGWLLRVLCFQRRTGNTDTKNDFKLENRTHTYEIETNITRHLEIEEANEEREAEEKQREPLYSTTWSAVGRVLDYILLAVFTLITVTETTYNMVRISNRIG
ncbi:Acetylcholine receptor subunit alpha-1-B [Mizuhopecten yessoensis]|uniref:Acetylcholine receptor subunit alpha-1-B n=1 Tax=Mizuhopecten yessoensis TaxID=6573 RepID=A0A210QIY0_MIZYE|nr:Acetylcholine receptor subunit alpha-1-B [Mizuhopecten yessoensis]